MIGQCYDAMKSYRNSTHSKLVTGTKASWKNLIYKVRKFNQRSFSLVVQKGRKTYLSDNIVINEAGSVIQQASKIYETKGRVEPISSFFSNYNILTLFW